ncbi:amidohydrolase family protein [Roseibium marinum]|uniref:5-methylthioadenosine/S-adenosylhomocysteine deaminase n=1 Tax=Roseibium marinum TaxID=281252 RepID=A0A2S3USY6_9HYPH|nr:amidohydrolase [Roseibium marinum]POF30835.1 5-methylthioadenosine/S-adenosylhomocysteine deaminase [Roseibium marinum]
MSDPDLILAGGHLLTMDPGNTVLVDGAVAIADGEIRAVGTRKDLLERYPDTPLKHLPDAVLMPGLVNAHAHSGFLRGTAEHLPVWDWLTLHINPMHRMLQPHEARAASRLCYAESVLGGTTTIVDMWRYMDGSAEVAEAIGNRLVAVPYVGEHPDYNYFDTLDMNEQLIETWHRKANGRVNVWVGLEHLFYADDAGMKRAVDMAKNHRTGFHTHCSEAEIEVAEFETRFGKRPMYVLEDFGFFETPRAMIAHAVWLQPDEIDLISGYPVSVAHNPVSNMKLASGIAPIADMLEAGVAVGLGTDGEKENNNFDMFEEMKVASLLGKLKDRDAAAMDSWNVLRMATIGGARAIGLDHEIGSIEPGKRADIIAVRTDTPRMTPLFGSGPWFNLQHNLVHAVRGSDVAMTMIDGQIVVEDGQLLTGDLTEILDEIHTVAPPLFKRRAAWLAENKSVQWGTEGKV